MPIVHHIDRAAAESLLMKAASTSTSAGNGSTPDPKLLRFLVRTGSDDRYVLSAYMVQLNRFSHARISQRASDGK